MSKRNPFDSCPVYETRNLKFELVKQTDAEDLFECYSDPITLGHMNNDNCGGVWNCKNIDVMKLGILGWRSEFKDKFYIRWSVYHKTLKRIIGTIEIAPVPNTTRFFDGVNKTGILRVDLISNMEKKEVFSEILEMTKHNLFSDFGIKNIIMKSTPEDTSRIEGLVVSKFEKVIRTEIIRFPHYYIFTK